MEDGVPTIPKSCRQTRSHKTRPSRRRGLFSFSSCKDTSSTATTASSDQHSDVPISGHKEDIPEFSLFHCNMLCNGKNKGVNLKPTEVPTTDRISVTDEASLSFPNNRITGLQFRDHTSVDLTEGLLASPPDTSMLQAARCVDDWLAPGNVVWAKTAYHEWWPAEVMEEGGVVGCSNDQQIGHILVQFYGSHEYTWLDPAGDLSQFDHCNKERSRNPLKAFQDALNQAICRHAHTSTRTSSDGCSGETRSPIQYDKPFETCNTPSSSRTKDDYDEVETGRRKRKVKNRCSGGLKSPIQHDQSFEECSEGRGRRKRKAKTHFDELTCPENPARKTRRLRIMRQLGLIAPVGSPFARTYKRTA